MVLYGRNFSFVLIIFVLSILSSLVDVSEATEISKSPKIVDSVEKFNQLEGSNATITCTVGSGELDGITYDWYKDDKRLVATGNVKISQMTPDMSVLKIFGVKQSDSATYSCVARNHFGQDRILVKLSVKVQMKWVEEPRDLRLSVGRRAQIPCSATGVPSPIIQWTKVGEDRLFGSELIFTSVNQSDSGYYECRASNGVEKDLISRMKLEVLVGPSVTAKCVGSIVAGKFRLVKLLGSGSYGAVFLGKNLLSGELVAVKLEHKAIKAPQLPLEYRFIKMIGQTEGFPHIIKIDECANTYHAMVMELLGPSLEEVFNVCERKLGLKSVLYLSLQLLTRFQTLHSKNIIYRDVKPENFLLGRPGTEKENIVHIIDYGLAKEYINPESGTHIAFRGQKGAIGTARYMSINTHQGKEQSRRDDLEALGYVIIYLMKGALPWQGLPATDHKKRMKKIGDMKKKMPIEEICDRCPEEFASYLRYVRHLDFYDAPDYDYLRRLFYDLFIQYRFVDDGIYDWTGKFESKVVSER